MPAAVVQPSRKATAVALEVAVQRSAVAARGAAVTLGENRVGVLDENQNIGSAAVVVLLVVAVAIAISRV